MTEDLRTHRDDYIKQEVIRPCCGLPGPVKSLWAPVAVADPPGSWFHSQKLAPHVVTDQMQQLQAYILRP